MSPARRCRAVEHLQRVFGVSQRWALKLVGQHRSTQRHQPVQLERDSALRAELRQLGRAHPRWGYRRAHAQLRQQGWTANADFRVWTRGRLREAEAWSGRPRVLAAEGNWMDSGGCCGRCPW